MKRIITVTTDFGVKDQYVGVMKGVILSINCDAVIVDITHDIEPHSIVPAALIIKNSYKYFPEKSIHLVVVDPGVGSARRAIAASCNNHFFVGPDNGVFSLVFKESSDLKVFELENKNYFLEDVSSTFHGRDIFSPAAAHLSNGVSISKFGKKIKDPVTLFVKDYVIDNKLIRGEVIYKDSFGNLITNIPSRLVNKDSEIRINDILIEGISQYYSSVSEGSLLAIKGSTGNLEISVNKGSAFKFFNIDNLEIFIKNK
ncbi:MAG: SAM hydrolase/SAM-dependent halogenase family protein [Thermodesulfobacteriota bacterium]